MVTIMHFTDWMAEATETEKTDLARAADTSPLYLYLMEKGHKPVSPRMAAKLQKQSELLTPERIIDARASVTINAA